MVKEGIIIPVSKTEIVTGSEKVHQVQKQYDRVRKVVIRSEMVYQCQKSCNMIRKVLGGSEGCIRDREVITGSEKLC